MLAERKQELKALESDIQARKAYLREQEALIAEIIEKGNTQLMELSHDIAVAKQMLRDIKTDIRTAAHDKALLMQDIQGLQIQITQQTLIIAPAIG